METLHRMERSMGADIHMQVLRFSSHEDSWKVARPSGTSEREKVQQGYHNPKMKFFYVERRDHELSSIEIQN